MSDGLQVSKPSRAVLKNRRVFRLGLSELLMGPVQVDRELAIVTLPLKSDQCETKSFSFLFSDK